MSHDRGCPCGADKGEDHFPHCQWAKPDVNPREVLSTYVRTPLAAAEDAVKALDKKVSDQAAKIKREQEVFASLFAEQQAAVQRVAKLRARIK